MVASAIAGAVLGSYTDPQGGAEVASLVREFTGATMPPAPGEEADARLTPRETEVIRLIAAGRSNREIAADLVLSERTVVRHIANIYAKIGGHGRADATAYAYRHGLA